MTVDPTRVDPHVQTVVEWLVDTVSTDGEMLAILGVALAVVLDGVPLENRTERLLLLSRALDAALDDLHGVTNDDAEPWDRHSTRH